mmetsp:Transcript_56022/g.173596  ORF Transcript_56022/g.173596 Transcript_56022/m.173596 type:complete len:215 (-) Transcript_56022:510-1154(-)
MGSTGLPMESFRSMEAEALDCSGEQSEERGLATSLAAPCEEGGRRAAAAACCISCSSRSRHAGSRKMAQEAMRSEEAECGRGFETLMMILFWMALARHRMMWSTSKPARHSRICALSRDCAILARCGGAKEASSLFPRVRGLSDDSPGGGTAKAAARPPLGRLPTPAGAEPGACLTCGTSFSRSTPPSGRAVASGRLIFSASPQSLCVSSKVSL